MFLYIDKKLLQTTSNHPVHILNKNGDISTSSFIPFCSFGKDLIGAKMNGLDIPVCNIFKPKNHFDQICYETDLQKLKNNNKDTLIEQFEIGLTLILDYNEERQMDINDTSVEKSSLKTFPKDDSSVSLYLNTIGRYVFKAQIIVFV